MKEYIELDEITSRLTETQVFQIFIVAGCKEPQKLKVKSNGWATIRCCEHEDEENTKRGKRASLNVNLRTGAFRCMSCNYSGNLLTMAKRVTSTTREAFEFLKTEAGLSDSINLRPMIKKEIPPKKLVEYFYFDPKKPLKKVDLEKYRDKLADMSRAQQYKYVLTTIYRESLKTDQFRKFSYYENRKISKNSKLNLIGFIPKGSLEFWKRVEEKVSINLLVEFGIYNAPDAKYNPLTFKHDWTGPHCFVPSFDLYTDMLSGAMLRPVEKPKNGAKEFSLSLPDLVSPIPFALTNDALRGNLPIVLTEGSVDGLSFSEIFKKTEICSIPGVHALEEELYGLFKSKTVILAFDMDRAGRVAAEELAQQLKKIGAKVFVASWDETLGKDINELLQRGLLNRENLKLTEV